MVKKRKTYAFIAVAIVVIAGIVLLVTMRDPTQPLTREGLENARQLWARTGIKSYKMDFTMLDSHYIVRVHKSHVVSLLRDGIRPTTHRIGDFTVEGLFDTLERECDMLEDEDSPIGATTGGTILRVRFDPRLGYVKKYLRVIGGSNRSASIEVNSLAPWAPKEQESP